MNDFIVEESLGERGNEIDEIKSCFYEIIDVVLSEFNARFTENNEFLLAVSNSIDMEMSDLEPLAKLGLKLPSDNELKTAKKYVDKKKEDWEKFKEKDSQNRFNILTTLYEVKEAFPDVYRLYAAIDTFACSTAVCEASFSALTQINVANRLSMTNKRMRHLAFLAYEHKRLNNIDIEDILREFNNKKERKIQLF